MATFRAAAWKSGTLLRLTLVTSYWAMVSASNKDIAIVNLGCAADVGARLADPDGVFFKHELKFAFCYFF